MLGHHFSKPLTAFEPVAEADAEPLGQGGLSEVGQTLLDVPGLGLSLATALSNSPKAPCEKW